MRVSEHLKVLSGFKAERYHYWDAGKYCDNVSNRILGSWALIDCQTSEWGQGERGGVERMVFLSQVVCIYVNATLDLFIESIKILSLWVIQNLLFVGLSSPLWGTQGCRMAHCGAGSYVKGVSLVSPWSYEFYLPSRTWLRLWIVKENISLMFSSWIGHSVSWIVAPLGSARGVFF